MGRGRKQLNITRKDLNELILKGLAIPQMAKELNVGTSTISKYTRLWLSPAYMKQLRANGKKRMRENAWKRRKIKVPIFTFGTIKFFINNKEKQNEKIY